MQKTIDENKDLLKFNAEGVHPADMFLKAKDVAVKAVNDYMKDKEEPLYCGFANISIHPARGRFVSFMKKADIGSLGYGGGYYDKTISYLKSINHNFTLIGYAYDDQKIDKVIYDNFDQKLNYILTEKQLYKII